MATVHLWISILDLPNRWTDHQPVKPRLHDLEVMVTIQPKIECFCYPDNSAGRKKLAEDCYERVLGRFTEEEFDSEQAGEPGGDRPTGSLLS